MTGLLHDTVEDTVATLDDIERLFGPEIARLVDGVTKLSRIELQSDKTKQAENFRKLVLAMSEDIRVLLVKLADRLHNMQTLHFIKDAEKRRRIARETMEIYGPLAERMGMHRMKDELEDLAFAELHPDARASILARLGFLHEQGGDIVARIVAEMDRDAEGGRARRGSISGREKSPYSIWRKMQRKNVSFEQLADVMAFRVLVDNVADCYQALGVIHSAYQVVPGRFKDYISTPKPNNYRSLHTGVIGPERQRIEVQIRTRDMHEIAELGVAAHWIYKQQAGRSTAGSTAGCASCSKSSNTPRTRRSFSSTPSSRCSRTRSSPSRPKGDLIALPRGATPVDFAYAVHSEIGDTCVGAKINGRLLPLRTQLQNGDQVEIVTSKAQTPSPTWERFVVTGKARARIRRFIRTQQRAQYLDLGRAIVQKAFRQQGQEFSERPLEAVLEQFNCDTVEDLYVAVGEGLATGREVVNAAFPQPPEAKDKVVPLARARRRGHGARHGGADSRPHPGDGDAFRRLLPPAARRPHRRHRHHRQGRDDPHDRLRHAGQLRRRAGTLARRRLEQRRGRRRRMSAGINVTIANEPGNLGSLTTTIGKQGGNISNLKITNRSTDFFEILVDIEVGDVKHLSTIIAALRATPVINAVERARG